MKTNYSGSEYTYLAGSLLNGKVLLYKEWSGEIGVCISF